jgi:hypothetical protein
MDKPRDEVVQALRHRGEHDRAIAAECALPKVVDTERDAHLLLEFDVTEGTLEDEQGG